MSRFSFVPALGIVLSLMMFHQAEAQTWTTQTSANWSNAGSWNPGAPPAGGGPGIALNFSGANAAFIATNDLGNPFVANSITFGQRFTNITTIASAAGNTIELGGTNPFIGNPVVGGNDPNSALAVGVSITSTLTLNPSSGPVTFGNSGLGTLSILGIISSPGAVTLNIAGNNTANNWSFVRLAGANTFTGSVNLNGGHLVVGNATALGNAANTLLVNSGWIGASTATTLANNVTLNSDMQVMGLGGVLTLSGVISGNNGVRMSGMTSGTSGLTLTGANNYSGQTLITNAPLTTTNQVLNNGVLTISGASGAISNTSGVVIRGGTFTLNDTTAFTGGAAGRVNDSAGLTLAGSLFNLTAGATANYNETMAGLALDGGHNAVNLTATATSAAQASFTTLTRQNRSTALFRGTNMGNAPGVNVGTVSFSSAPTGDLIGGGGGAGSTNISILPYAIGDTTTTGTGSSLVTLDSGTIRPLTVAEYVATMTGGTTTTDNVRLTASLDLASATLTTSNALVMTTGTLSNSGGGAYRPTSGVILNSGVATISAPIDFGTREGIIFSPSALAVSGAISGSGGLTKSGSGALTLSGPNTYSGTTTINSGVISIANATALGNSTQIDAGGPNIILGTQVRAGITYNGTTTLALSQNINIRSGYLELKAVGTGAVLQLDGQISGAGGISVDSSGTNVVLTNNSNNYTGPTRVYFGNLVFSNDAQLGNGGAVDIGVVAGFGVILNGNWTTSRMVNISAISQMDTNGNNWTQNGAFTGTGALTKVGLGTWNLNSPITASTYTGTVAVNGGRLNVNGFLATSTNAVTVATGAFLGGVGEIDRPVTVNAGAIVSPGLSPGTLTVSTRSATAVTMAAGSIFDFEINNATGTLGVNWDRLLATNSPISLGNAMTVRLFGLDGANTLGATPNFNNGSDYLWEFMTAPSFTGTAFGSIAFTIDDSQFVNNNPLAGGTFSIVQVGSTGLGVQFTSAIPEPGSFALLGGLLVAACGWRNRRRHN